MARQTTPKEISKGVCTFCQGEFAKSKMTQHLKSCKERSAGTAAQEGHSQRLFHLFVEGKYRPGYWMHLEIPAAATLDELDSFLRSVWLECCGHLSEFEIDNVSYSANPDEDWDVGVGGLTLVDSSREGTAEDEDEDEDEDEGEMPDMEELASEMSRQLSREFQADLKDVPVGQIEQKLEQMFADNMPPGMSGEALPVLRPLLGYMAESLREGTLAQDLEAMEEDDEDGMESELGDVLEVGTKFSYTYDFGSSSTLSLRVLGERDGVMPLEEDEDLEDEDDEALEDDDDEDVDLEDDDEFEDDEDETTIFMMARNEPPVLVCHICGQPATRVPSASEYTPLAEVALCDLHARKAEYPDELLPIVNSPRTGICGYTGDDEEEDWDEEDWEEEDGDEDE